jgi:hypothetical protein
MTRRHRLLHRLIWPALAITVTLGLMSALALRPPAPTAQEQAK